MTENDDTKEIPFEEKIKIFDILRFTPANYSFQVYGYGGDSRFLKSSKEQYLYFKNNNIDIEDYAYEYDYEEGNKIPEIFQPFPPGSPYDGSELESANGATMDDSSTIEITDENLKTVFSCGLSPSALEEAGVQVEEVSEFYPEWDCKEGDVIIWYANGEKGTFYGSEVRMTKPFDPKKLKITYIDIDGWMILNNIEYDEQDVDNNDYSTSGKWSETKWIFVGGKEPTEETNLDTTDWFPSNEYKPKRKGLYECQFGGTENWPWSHTELVEWTGRKWNTENNIVQWRGLTSESYLEQLKKQANTI